MLNLNNVKAGYKHFLNAVTTFFILLNSSAWMFVKKLKLLIIIMCGAQIKIILSAKLIRTYVALVKGKERPHRTLDFLG